jgi:hypothetical protein
MGKVGRWGFAIPIPPDSLEEWHSISGQNILYKARGQDNAGNHQESPERELFVTQINQYPEVEEIFPAGVERKDPVPVRSISNDPDGHIERIEYSYSEGIPKSEVDWISIGMDFSPETPFEYTFGGNREILLRARAYDGDDWGFWTVADTSFFLDNTPPLTVSDISPAWHDTAFTVTLFRSDPNGSGFDTTGTTYYSFDGSNPTIEGLTFDITQPGEYTVKYYSIDDAGNEETVRSDTARMDNVLPFGASASSPDTAFALYGADTTHFVIEWTTGDDIHSGVSGTYRIGYKDDTYGRGDWTVLEESASGSTYVFAPAEVGHVYRLEVGAIDLAGNQEPLYFGTGETRTYVKSAPDPPSSPSPTNAGGEELPPDGTLGWDVDPSLTGHLYHLQVDDDSLFASPEIDVDSIPGDVPKVTYSVVLDSLEGYDDLIDDTYYFWRVSVTDKYGQESGFSDPLMFFFNKTNSAPLAVTGGFMPADGDVITDSLVIFWGAAEDPDLSDTDSTLAYAIYLDDDGEFMMDYAFMYMTGQGETSFVVPDSLTENVQWYYSLVTVDDDGDSSAMSDTQNFWMNVVNSAPGAFTWAFPAPGDTLVLSEDTLRLRWQDALDPDPFDTVRYRLRYGTDPDLGRDTCTVDTIVYATSYLIDEVPCSGDPWPNMVYWKVTALDLEGSSTQGGGGATWNFIVDPGTDVVLMSFTADDVDGTAVLKWRVAESSEPLSFDVYRAAGESRSGYVELEGEPVRGVDGSYVFVDVSVEPGQTYSYKLGITEGVGPQFVFGPIEVVIAKVTGDAVLVWNYPNPFNPSTNITYHVPESEVSSAVAVSLKIYDVSGKLIRTLVDDLRVPGYHSVTWNGVDAYGEPAGSGVYYYVLSAGGNTVTKRMVLLK